MHSNPRDKKPSSIEILRPRPESWDGPYFRLFQCGEHHVTEPLKPHALFMDAMEPQALGAWSYVLSGAMYYRLGDMRYRVEAGQALVTLRPDPGWMLRPCDKGPVRTIWITVTAEPALQYFNYLHLKYGQIQTFPPDSEAVRLAQRLIRQVAANPHRPADHWSEMTFRWLSAWWRCAREHQKHLGPQSLEAVQPSRLISCTTKTIKNFAAEMGYSRAYLTRKLTQQWHRSPGRALREVRLAEAARLLRTTRMSIRDVAAKVDYSTSASFAQAFRHQYQQTPSAYRNTHR